MSRCRCVCVRVAAGRVRTSSYRAREMLSNMQLWGCRMARSSIVSHASVCVRARWAGWAIRKCHKTHNNFLVFVSPCFFFSRLSLVVVPCAVGVDAHKYSYYALLTESRDNSTPRRWVCTITHMAAANTRTSGCLRLCHFHFIISHFERKWFIFIWTNTLRFFSSRIRRM